MEKFLKKSSKSKGNPHFCPDSVCGPDSGKSLDTPDRFGQMRNKQLRPSVLPLRNGSVEKMICADSAPCSKEGGAESAPIEAESAPGFEKESQNFSEAITMTQ